MKQKEKNYGRSWNRAKTAVSGVITTTGRKSATADKQVDAILSLPHIVGFCYTQLTDVEQEENGIYNYDRTEKFDMARIKAIFSKQK